MLANAIEERIRLHTCEIRVAQARLSTAMCYESRGALDGTLSAGAAQRVKLGSLARTMDGLRHGTTCWTLRSISLASFYKLIDDAQAAAPPTSC